MTRSSSTRTTETPASDGFPRELLVQPPNAGASSYSKVRLWVAQESGALMKAEAYGRDGKPART